MTLSLPIGDRGAILSDDGVYRYALHRRWDPDAGDVLFIMLNPSTADADEDDPTIRRCVAFARSWGYGGLLVANLYAYRATRPVDLDDAEEPIGPENQDHLYGMSRAAARVVAAWGATPARGQYVHRELSVLSGPLYDVDVYALGTTRHGHPRHPLYVPAATRPFLWVPAHSTTPCGQRP